MLSPGGTPSAGSRRSGIARPVAIVLAIATPAVLLRLLGFQPAAGPGILVFGAAIVAAAFLLAWAAEAAETDISGGLAIAVLALITVLPEYAVDLYFGFSAGSHPEHVPYAAANMTGSNRLLLGLGWSTVVLLGLAVASRRSGTAITELVLGGRYRLEIGFLAIAALLSMIIPVSGRINIGFGLLLLGLFAFYLVRTARADHGQQPDLVGPAARIADLSAGRRRPLLGGMFVIAAGVLLASAAPFANALVAGGDALGVDRFLLVQWLAPLASEAPELIVAILFATRGKSVTAIGMLIAAKINQWTLLVGSLPIAYLLGGGSLALPLDARQVEEFLLTAAQTALAVAALLTLRFSRRLAVALLALFAVQFALPGTDGRLLLAAVYAAIALALVVVNRHHILPTLAAPFRRHRPNRNESLSPRSAPAARTADGSRPDIDKTDIEKTDIEANRHGGS